jgi:transcriptional repressor NrdR
VLMVARFRISDHLQQTTDICERSIRNLAIALPASHASQWRYCSQWRNLRVKCPFCAHVDDKVIDSREGRTGDTIRRRRECLKCSRRFTTYERIDEIPYMVIKKDGRRERFERQKILQGLLKACEKRPVPTPKLESIVDEIEGVVHEATERELTTTEIGEMIMHRLKKLDKVAYVRFASVYMDFKDVQEFMSELKNLLKDRVIKR